MVLQLDFLGPDTLPLLLVASGLVVSILEALAPGAHLIVLGVALLAAGLVGLLLGPVAAVLASPFVLGLLVILFGGLAFYGYRELDIYGGKGQQQTSDSDSLRGSTGRVTEAVTPTGGEIKLDGGGFSPYYSARSVEGEIPEGTEVMVVDPGGGNVVTVESLEASVDDIDRELARGRERRTDSSAVEDGANQGSERGENRETEPETERERE